MRRSGLFGLVYELPRPFVQHEGKRILPRMLAVRPAVAASVAAATIAVAVAATAIAAAAAAVAAAVAAAAVAVAAAAAAKLLRSGAARWAACCAQGLGFPRVYRASQA